jgi:hypothetical protein
VWVPPVVMGSVLLHHLVHTLWLLLQWSVKGSQLTCVPIACKGASIRRRNGITGAWLRTRSYHGVLFGMACGCCCLILVALTFW